MKKKEIPLKIQIVIVGTIFGMLGAFLIMTVMAWQNPGQGRGNNNPTPPVEWVLKHHHNGASGKCIQGNKPKHADNDWHLGPCHDENPEQPPTPVVETNTPVPPEQPTSVPNTPVPQPTSIPNTPIPTEKPTEVPVISNPTSVPSAPTTSSNGVEAVVTLPAPTTLVTSTLIFPPYTGPNNSLEPDETEEICDICEAQEAKLWGEARWYNAIADFVEQLSAGWVPDFWYHFITKE